MSRELKIHAACDAPGCGKEYIVEEGDLPLTITIDGETHELDLCAKSKAEFRQMWLTAARPATVTRLKPKGKKTGAPKIKLTPDEYPCPLDDCASTPISQGSLRAHLRQTHKWPSEKIVDHMVVTYGVRKAPRTKCPECGESVSIQNLKSHRWRHHGVDE